MFSHRLVADLEWLPGDDLWWIVAAGVVASLSALAIGARALARPTSSRVKPPPSAEPLGLDPDPFAAGSATERRQAHRRKGSTVSVRISDVDDLQPPWQGWVIDRSVGGLGLYSESLVATGTLLKVLPVNAPPMTPWVDVEVRSSKPHETGYHLGCAFIKTPSYGVLLLFG